MPQEKSIFNKIYFTSILHSLAVSGFERIKYHITVCVSQQKKSEIVPNHWEASPKENKQRPLLFPRHTDLLWQSQGNMFEWFSEFFSARQISPCYCFSSKTEEGNNNKKMYNNSSDKICQTATNNWLIYIGQLWLLAETWKHFCF